MALGGGKFLTQYKVLPGAYINFVSVAKATANLSKRGVVAIPTTLGLWDEGTVKTITTADFQKNSLELFGYGYTADELKPLRDLYLNVSKVHMYKLPTNDGVKAESSYGSANVSGLIGNSIKLNVSETDVDGETHYTIETYYNNALVYTDVIDPNNIVPIKNEYWTMKDSIDSWVTGWVEFNGGADGTVTAESYQSFLDVIESYSFNIVALPSADETLKGLFATWTKRMRDEVGAKFQTVLHKYEKADYEGVISIDNNETPELVYYVAGAEAGCNVNKSLTNSKYMGEFEIDTNYTQTELEDCLKSGKLVFHKVGDEVRILEDINTYVSFTEEKSEDFASNQTIRVLDQIGNDIATLFANKYLGKIPNDASGRISLWNDIVKHHQELENLRAIENFNPDSLKVEPGEHKKAVVITDYVTPVNAMAQLYMTVYVQ